MEETSTIQGNQLKISPLIFLIIPLLELELELEQELGTYVNWGERVLKGQGCCFCLDTTQITLVLAHVLEERTINHPLQLFAEIFFLGLSFADLLDRRGPLLLDRVLVHLHR